MLSHKLKTLSNFPFLSALIYQRLPLLMKLLGLDDRRKSICWNKCQTLLQNHMQMGQSSNSLWLHLVYGLQARIGQIMLLPRCLVAQLGFCYRESLPWWTDPFPIKQSKNVPRNSAKNIRKSSFLVRTQVPSFSSRVTHLSDILIGCSDKSQKRTEK